MRQCHLIAAFCTALLLPGTAFAHNHDTATQQVAQHSDHGAHGSHAGHGDAAKQAAPEQSAAIKDYEAAMAKMHQDMVVKYSGDVDVDFVRGMIPHHQGAIDMAKVLLEHGSDPRLRRLAQGIIAAQQKEINFMKNWIEAKEAKK